MPEKDDILDETFSKNEPPKDDPKLQEPIKTEEPVKKEDEVKDPIVSLEEAFSNKPVEKQEDRKDTDPIKEDKKAPSIIEMNEELFEEVTTSHQKFAEFLSGFRDKIVEETRGIIEKTVEENRTNLLKELPEVVQSTYGRTTAIQQAAREFYAENPDLKDKANYVARTTNYVAAQNPSWGPKEVLAEVAKIAKEELSLSQQAGKREKERSTSSKPVFAGEGGRRSPGAGEDNRTPQQKLLDETFAR